MKIKKLNINCSFCQKSILRRQRDILNAKKGIYCSRICYGLSQRKEHPCIICQKLIPAGAHKQTCSKMCEKANYLRPDRLHSKGRKKINKNNSRKTSTRSFKKFYFLRHKPECALCKYNSHIEVLNIHHIIEKSNGGSDEDDNLISLCPTCHTEVHKGFKKI